MDVEIVSAERIKPSFPTPNHLRDFKLCLLDQLIPADYAPIVIFYPNQTNSNHSSALEKQALLKMSLSETLSRFFPLAGTIKDDLSIDCNDQGACFITAKVKNCLLSDFLESPDLKFIAKFLPCGMTRKSSDCVTNIQVSEFECGGMCVGICISHRILDGAALSTFLKSWAGFASPSGDKKPISPDFSASSLFPTNGSWLRDASMAMWGSLIKKKVVTRRFVFNGSAIKILREMATGLTGTRPTRVETVTGFIWKCAMAACEERYGFRKSSMMTHMVNLRKRAVPSFSEQSIGNLAWVASAKFNAAKESHNKFPELVDEVRKCVSKVDGGFVKTLRNGEEGKQTMQRCLKEIERFGFEVNMDHIGFTSWCNMGFDEVDFGWGRPVWVSSIDASGPFFMNLVILIDARFGGGMEAWVTLDEQEMAMLEQNQEFQAFASFNPSPLKVIANGDD